MPAADRMVTRSADQLEMLQIALTPVRLSPCTINYGSTGSRHGCPFAERAKASAVPERWLAAESGRRRGGYRGIESPGRYGGVASRRPSETTAIDEQGFPLSTGKGDPAIPQRRADNAAASPASHAFRLVGPAEDRELISGTIPRRSSSLAADPPQAAAPMPLGWAWDRDACLLFSQERDACDGY